MVKNLEGKVWTAYCKLSRNLRATVLPNFRTEQSSNDHISSLCKQQNSIEALEAFAFLQKCSNIRINISTVLSACGILLQPEYGRQIHGMSLKFGLGQDTVTGCSLSDMYAKFGFLGSAKTAFCQIDQPDLVSWNAIIAGFAYAGDVNAAMSIFSQMRHLELTPDDITVRSLLCACIAPDTLFHGKQLHSYIIKMAFDFDVLVCNTLLSMYGRTRSQPQPSGASGHQLVSLSAGTKHMTEIVDRDWKSSMLSLVKAFDSLLAKHEVLPNKILHISYWVEKQGD
ncbi:hypothetical protein RJ639_045992 [Escallonia herrerae]|uniref:Pentatricopeptide repeat-containing protein n=1 Tax=Escallonia herrerae TaxID=1293975 RepID=A0AA89AXZ7_9ASTE|nr:hypothetical protein RJ639_045992 [Escallonia herrerae]